MKFEVYAHVTIGMHCVVEAESREAAEAQAEEATMMSLCWGCAEGVESRHGMKPDEWRTSGELDGTPVIQSVLEYAP